VPETRSEGKGDAGLASRKISKKEKRIKRLQMLIVILLVLLLASGLGLGLYFGLPGSKSAAALLEEGETAFSEGRYEDAVELYRKAIKEEPGYQDAYNRLGMAYQFLYNQNGGTDIKEEEIEAFRKAVELDPNNYKSLVNLGLALFYQGSKKEAAAYLKKAVELYPNPNDPYKATLEDMVRQAESGQ
jgi:tetratricopeptide (TPR) repeat protein